MTALRLRDGRLDDLAPFRSSPLSEVTLIRGYVGASTARGPVVRTEGCACGGVIEQAFGEDVMDVVAAHITTERHLAWSAQTRDL